MDLLQMPGVVKCEFKKNEYLIRQGEQVDYIYYLLKGSCYRTTITERGDEIIYGIKDTHDFIRSLVGVMVIYGDGISASHMIARTKCEGYKIPKDVFKEYAQKNPEILAELVGYAFTELRNVVSTFQARMEGRIANRLCDFLLKNSYSKQDKLFVEKRLNNAEISRFLGIHKVTVAKIIKVLKEEEVITKSRDGIAILDAARLKAYAKAEINLNY